MLAALPSFQVVTRSSFGAPKDWMLVPFMSSVLLTMHLTIRMKAYRSKKNIMSL
eukprot:c29821_g1_i1 orf=2-160(-)